jgi:ABC-type phosphate transport system substrate-binding protein
MYQRKLISLIAAAGCFAGTAAADIVVVVSPKNPLASLTQSQVAALYLGNASTFPNGASAVLADQPATSASRDVFYEKVVGRSSAQAKAVWARIVFTGKGTPPKEFGSAAEVKAFLASNPGAIGYLDSTDVDGSVKAVLTMK